VEGMCWAWRPMDAQSNVADKSCFFIESIKE